MVGREATHERYGHEIKCLGTGNKEQFKSINAAKRESRALQKSGKIVRLSAKAYKGIPTFGQTISVNTRSK